MPGRRRRFRHLARLANVDDLEAVLERLLERLEADFDLLRLGRVLPGERNTAARVLRTSARASSPHARDRHRQQIEHEELLAELPGQIQQQLQGLERLKTSEGARHGTEHTRLRAVADEAVARGVRPYAA